MNLCCFSGQMYGIQGILENVFEGMTHFPLLRSHSQTLAPHSASLSEDTTMYFLLVVMLTVPLSLHINILQLKYEDHTVNARFN